MSDWLIFLLGFCSGGLVIYSYFNNDHEKASYLLKEMAEALEQAPCRCVLISGITYEMLNQICLRCKVLSRFKDWK